MSRKRLLSLTWVGSDGEPYHTAELSPRCARDVIAKQAWPKLFIDHKQYPLHCLTYAEVSRAKISVRVRLTNEQQILIDIV